MLPSTFGAPARQAYRLLQLVFVVAPVVAGIDKFFDKLVHWDQYVAPIVSSIVGGHAHALMLVAGVVEIIAGIGVAVKPRIFSYIVAAWLSGIVVNLLLCGTYFDIALRDFGLALSALALGRLANAQEHGQPEMTR